MSNPDQTFAAKTAWHNAQRRLSPRAKVAQVIALQRRELELNAARKTAGRPIRQMVVWNVRP